jgi:hypothetical protein
LLYAQNTYQRKFTVSLFADEISDHCTELLGFCSLLFIVFKQRLTTDSTQESSPNFKELTGKKEAGDAQLLPQFLTNNEWKVTGTIKKIRRWLVVTGKTCREKVYPDEKSNYHTLFGQSEPNSADRTRRISATFHRIRRKSANRWQHLCSTGS